MRSSMRSMRIGILFQAKLDLAQIKQKEFLAVVQLYKALGGEWQ
jgi:outer membrane protein TolC